MPDVLTPQQRHYCMTRIRGIATKPEILVRQWLWSHNYRYRLNVKSAPGKPDIVLRKYRTAIFVNGCFWHGHEGCSKYVVPKSNTEFWISKIERNKERDRKEYNALLKAGWKVIVIWECQLKKGVLEETMRDVEHLLNKNLLEIYK